MSGKKVARAAAAVTAVPVAFMIKRKAENPESGWANIAMNTLLAPQYAFKSGPFQKELTFENTMKSAMAVSNLTDFGPVDPDILFRSTADLMSSPAFKSLKFSPFGFLSTKENLKGDMVAYLKQIQYFKDVPAISEQRIRDPVFVVGLFRSGTTNLHRLLALDPAHRSPVLWELGSPPPDSTDPVDMRRELQALRDKFAEDVRMAKTVGDWARFDIMHMVDTDLPEECQVAFGSIVPVTVGPFFYASVTTPGAMDNLQLPAAHAHYKKVLQMLAYHDKMIGVKEPQRWVMKGPLHLFNIKSLARTFPDAQLVW